MGKGIHLYGGPFIIYPVRSTLQEYKPLDSSFFCIDVSFGIRFSSLEDPSNYHFSVSSPTGAQKRIEIEDSIGTKFAKPQLHNMKIMAYYDKVIIHNYINNIIEIASQLNIKQAKIYLLHHFIHQDLLDMKDVDYFRFYT